MSEADADSNQVVEEFPAPPSYFRSSSSLRPPAIPPTDPYLEAYGGQFASVTQSRPVFDPTKDYKTVLKGHLKQVMSHALTLVPYANPQTSGINIPQQAAHLKNELAELHKVLAEYRIHEARENYIADLKQQVEDLKAIETDMQRCLDETSVKVKGVM